MGGGEGERLRGVGAELNRSLIGGLSEVRQKVADLLLAGIDDLTAAPVDGGGHLLTQVLKRPRSCSRRTSADKVGSEGTGGSAGESESAHSQLRS